MVNIAGTDTTELSFITAKLTLELVSRKASEIDGFFIATYNVTFSGKASNDVVYTTKQTIEFEAFEPLQTAIEQTESAKTIATKYLEHGNVIILRNGVKYNTVGTIIK